MKSVCSLDEFKQLFGDQATEAEQILMNRYHLFQIKENHIYFRFSLEELFKESFDIFSYDKSLLDDVFTINDLFTDDTIDPDIISNLFDLLDSVTDYDSITLSGELWMTFDDIRTYYGETEFDTEMKALFSNYDSFKEYISESI